MDACARLEGCGQATPDFSPRYVTLHFCGCIVPRMRVSGRCVVSHARPLENKGLVKLA